MVVRTFQRNLKGLICFVHLFNIYESLFFISISRKHVCLHCRIVLNQKHSMIISKCGLSIWFHLNEYLCDIIHNDDTYHNHKNTWWYIDNHNDNDQKNKINEQQNCNHTEQQWPLLSTWFNFNPSMDDMSSKVRDKITYPFQNFIGATVWELINNFIPLFIMGVVIHPC